MIGAERTLVDLPRYSDERGHLVAVTAGEQVPFAVRRVFWIFGNQRALPRAAHAHPTTTELLVCVAGACRVRMAWAGGQREIVLDRPDASVLVPPMTWLELTDFTPDCVLLVLADTPYDPHSAITDREAIVSRSAP